MDLFNELIGNPDDLKKECGKYYEYKGYLYSKKDIKLLFYDEKNGCFWVDYTNIWEKFDQKFGLRYSELRDLFACLLEESFKCKVTTAKCLREILHLGKFQIIKK